jgi:aminoglycoside 6-adenylyltransferase
VDHQSALDAVVEWAVHNENIRVVVLTGSGARGPAEMDDLSDLDLELYVDRPSELLEQSSWYEELGDVLVVEKLSNPGWFPTRLVYYVNGKIDFLIAPTSAVSEAKYVRPFRVLLDKEGTGNNLRVATTSHNGLPDEAEILECVNGFYAAALMCAKCLVRGELWMAKLREFELMGQMLQMIEWDHKARYGPDFDTWYLGVHLCDWMDEDLKDDVAACWGRFDVEDSSRALSKAIMLFGRLADRTADELGHERFAHFRVDQELNRTLDQFDASST